MRSDVKKSLIFLCFFIGGFLLLRLSMPIAMPFLLGLGLAVLAEPLVRVLCGRLRLPRPLASPLGVTAVLAGALGAVGAAGYLLAERAARVLPGMARDLISFVGGLQSHLPPWVYEKLSILLDDGTRMLSGAAGKALGFAGAAMQQLPSFLLALGTGVLAAYLFSARLPSLRENLGEYCRAKGLGEIPKRMEAVGRSLAGWLSCQVRLVLVTLGILTAGLGFLRVENALLWAGIICIVDILPILGIGTVMLPWSALCALSGDLPRAAGLAGVYVIAAVTRSVLEPKLLGDHLGLSPLATLAAMYGGFRLWGLAGLITVPLVTASAAAVMREGK